MTQLSLKKGLVDLKRLPAGCAVFVLTMSALRIWMIRDRSPKEHSRYLVVINIQYDNDVHRRIRSSMTDKSHNNIFRKYRTAAAARNAEARFIPCRRYPPPCRRPPYRQAHLAAELPFDEPHRSFEPCGRTRGEFWSRTVGRSPQASFLVSRE